MTNKKWEVTQEVIDEAEKLAGLGLNMEQISWNLGINPSTLYKYKAQMGALKDAISRGCARGIASMAGNLKDQAENGNTHATMFYLKNRAPDQWANDIQNVAKIQVNLSRISDSELLNELREDPALLNAVNIPQLEDK